jgi:hypothetical protein
MVRTGATVTDACEEYLRYIDEDRQRKPSTLRDYDSIFHNHVIPHLGYIPLGDLTPERVERWAASDIDPDRQLSNRTREKIITVFHGCMERARKLYRLPSNPVADVEKPRPAAKTEIEVFSPEEVMALVRAADSGRTPRSTSPPPSPACDRANSSPSAGETWTSRRGLRGLRHRVRASYANGHSPHQSPARSDRSRWPPRSPRRWPGSAARPLRRRGRHRLLRHRRRLSRRVSAVEALPRRTRASRIATAAVPRPPPHVRHASHRRRLHPSSPGVDGPRESPDDHAVPPLRPAPARRRARR